MKFRCSIEDRRAVRAPRRAALGVVIALLTCLSSPALAAPVAARDTTATLRSSRCPWTSAAAARRFTPAQLAAQVVAKMTLSEKLLFVDLRPGGGYENHNTGVARLCIPWLTLQDGPNGIAYNDTGVTQLPASLGVAASFDPSLAFRYGAVIGTEARRQGVAVVQGPNLNLDRIPTSGRAFEAYGEDPFLTSQMGAADIEGIQSAGVMADAKHFTGYTQETDRLRLDQVIPTRALQELYLAPFRAAVTEAHVASVMCAYGQINEVYVCQDPGMFELLKEWGFTGFVRSDLGAVQDPVAAFNAGLDAIKPDATAVLAGAVAGHRLAMSRLDDAVASLLREMFAYGLVRRPLTGHTDTKVTTPAASALALQATERSVVLLQNRSGLLPLDPHTLGSVAVVGPDAAGGATTAGFGSAHVLAPYVITPLAALRRQLGRAVSVTYSPGGPQLAQRLPLLALHGAPAAPVRALLQRSLTPPATSEAHRAGGVVLPSAPASELVNATAVQPGSGGAWRRATTELTPRSSGLYTVSLTGSGDSFLYLSDKSVIADRGLHGRSSWSTTIALTAGHRYSLMLRWLERPGFLTPAVGVQPVSADIARAVRAARHAKVAIVFADDYSSEGVDRPSLELPGDENALIDAVAAANPHTVVVLNTGGPVLMPWLSKVSAVLEAWYPGEADGSAITAVLTGADDPSGHLPVTFPQADQQRAVSSASWPGVAGRVDFGSSLDIGYRYDDQLGLQPLFPFGYGLSYTSFSVADPVLSASPTGTRVTVTVTNIGARAGRAVVQGYLGFPIGSGEPPRQLAAFGTVQLAPGASATVDLDVAGASFEAWLGGHFRTLSGSYRLFIGQSSRDLPLEVALAAPESARAAAGSPAAPGTPSVAPAGSLPSGTVPQTSTPPTSLPPAVAPDSPVLSSLGTGGGPARN